MQFTRWIDKTKNILKQAAECADRGREMMRHLVDP